MSIPHGLSLALLFVTLAGGGVCVALIAISIRTRRSRLAWATLTAAAGWSVLYTGVLAATSLRSRERVLYPGEAKAFCGAYLDCHIHIAVEDVTVRAALGPAGHVARTPGFFVIVTLRLSSDAVAAALAPGPLEMWVVDASGRRFKRSLAAEQALAQAEGPLGPLERPVVPGASYTRRVVFELPRESEGWKLLVREGGWLTRLSEWFLIGDEDSFLHRRTWFRIDPDATPTRGRGLGPASAPKAS